jgi:hypothetical protein
MAVAVTEIMSTSEAAWWPTGRVVTTITGSANLRLRHYHSGSDSESTRTVQVSRPWSLSSTCNVQARDKAALPVGPQAQIQLRLEVDCATGSFEQPDST